MTVATAVLMLGAVQASLVATILCAFVSSACGHAVLTARYKLVMQGVRTSTNNAAGEILPPRYVAAADGGVLYGEIDYVDSRVRASWVVSAEQISLRLTNQTREPMRLDWSAAAFTGLDGTRSKLSTEIGNEIVPPGGMSTTSVHPLSRSFVQSLVCDEMRGMRSTGIALAGRVPDSEPILDEHPAGVRLKHLRVFDSVRSEGDFATWDADEQRRQLQSVRGRTFEIRLPIDTSGTTIEYAYVFQISDVEVLETSTQFGVQSTPELPPKVHLGRCRDVFKGFVDRDR